MNKTISWCLLICAVAVCICLSVYAPWILSDQNEFLKNFVNHQFLHLLGIIAAITLASAASLHLEFNKIEDLAKQIILSKTRSAVKKSAFSLIFLFATGFALVLLKPLVVTGDISASLVNGFAAIIVLFNVLVLVDLTKLVFRIEPIFKMMPTESGDDGSEDKL